MEKCRTLKRYGADKSRAADEPYKVPLVHINDELFLRLYDELDKDTAIVTIVFDPQEISERNSLHFNATETEDKSDIRFHGDIKFKRIILPQR